MKTTYREIDRDIKLKILSLSDINVDWLMDIEITLARLAG